MAIAIGGPLLILIIIAAWRARLIAPDPTVIVLDRNSIFICEVRANPTDELGFWPINESPPRVVAATLALEDRRFASHPGVDPIAIGRAIMQNFRTGERVSGASTLAMQIARMQHPGSRSYLRKSCEALTAIFLTLRYGRQAILTHYLRIAPYGNSIHGINYAARRYLAKPVEDLSWAEIAYLSALPQAPSRMNPFDEVGRVRAIARGTRILGYLRESDVITATEHELAVEQIDELRMPEQVRRPIDAIHLALRMDKELVRPGLSKNGEGQRAQGRGLRKERSPERNGATNDAAALQDGETKRRNQLIVHATIDLTLQKRLANELRHEVSALEERGAGNAALLVVDRRTNEVLADVPSTGFFDEPRRGAIDYSRVERSPGSTLKPFIYALALDLGVITPASILDDLQRGPGGIQNADEDFLGPLLPRVALANSRNVPAVNLLARIGIDQGFVFLQQLGLHNGRIPARSYGLGLAVGGMPVTLERLVRAYSIFTSDGRLGELVWLRDAPQSFPVRMISPEAARTISLFLSDPMARLPSFPRMGTTEYPFPVAVKTGTSPEMRDAWAVAYSSRYLVGVWVGRPDYRPMTHLTGYAAAANIAQRVLLSLHPTERDGLVDLSFPPPNGYQPVRLCATSGLRASSECDKVLTEYVRGKDIPPAVCDAHARLAVDVRTGRIADAATPSRFREERLFVVLSPRYAAWATIHGIPVVTPQMAHLKANEQAGRAGTNLARLPFGQAPRVRITSPRLGFRFFRDPETPVAQGTLALQVVVEPPVKQVVWYVDDRPFITADYPYTARWPLLPGEHTFSVRLPYGNVVSSPVKVIVQ